MLQRHQFKLPQPLPVVKLTYRRYLRREGPLYTLNYFDITNFLGMPQQRAVLQLATNKAFVERHHLFFTAPENAHNPESRGTTPRHYFSNTDSTKGSADIVTPRSLNSSTLDRIT